MKLFVILIVAFLVSCKPDSNDPQGPVRTEVAFLTDNRGIADGCENHIVLYPTPSSMAVQYKPTSATSPILQRMLLTIPTNTNSYRHPVTVRFRETGNQVKLVCGWVSPMVPEIDLLEITPR